MGYHLVNVLLHAASSVLLWRVLVRLKIPGAWLAAAIFALHPVNVESVAWITERKNTLAMFFYAWALLWYLRFDDTGRRCWYWLGSGRLCPGVVQQDGGGAAALGAVGSGLVAARADERPDVLAHSSVFRDRRDCWACDRLVAISSGHRRRIVRADIFWSRLAGAGWAVWFYLYKALWPLNLMFVYPRWSIEASKPLSYLPGLLAVAAGVVCWRYRRRWGRPALLALGYFVVMLLPVLGFLNIYFMRYSLVADHWQYFAIFGPIALLAAALTAAGESLGRAHLRLGVAPGGAVLLALGALTWNQSHIYADQETLWQDTLAKNPACWLAHNNLGNTLLNKGQTDEAISHFQEAIRLEPENALAHNNLGGALGKKGQLDEAIRQYEEAIRLKPDDALVHNNLGTTLYRKGRTDEAIRHYQEAIRLEPENAEAHHNLGLVLVQKGQWTEAIAHYQKALAIQPGAVPAQNDLAWLLATCPQAARRNGVRAVELAQAADRLSGGKNPEYLDTLGAAYAEAGQFPQAVEVAKRTLALAVAQKNPHWEEFRARLKLYQGGTPYHEPPPHQ